MSDAPTSTRVIRRDAVRLVPRAALVDCSTAASPGQGPLAVVPLLDGDRIAGFEIRCGCGASALVECVYPTPAQKP